MYKVAEHHHCRSEKNLCSIVCCTLWLAELSLRLTACGHRVAALHSSEALTFFGGGEQTKGVQIHLGSRDW
jgi:hypothetical protein